MSSLVSTARDQGSRDAVRTRTDGSVEIAEVWLILWQRRVMIVAAAAVLSTIALLYSLLTPALFTAASQILVDPRDRIVMNNDVNPSALSPDGGVAQVESQSSVLRSNGVLIRAIRAARLAEDKEFAEKGLLTGLLEMLGKRETATADGLSPAENRALERLRKAVAVKRADKTLVLDIIVTTKAADKSAMIANAVAESYLADQAEARSRNARDASASITARLAELRRRVEEAENAVERYRVENNLVTSSGRPITDQQLGEMSSQFAAAQARVAALRAQVEDIARRRDGVLAGSSTEATQSAVIAKLREQESTLMQRDADLQTQLGPLHPQVQASRNQLENVRRLIATEIRRVEQTVRAELDRALGNERQLAARLEILTRANQGSDQAAVRLRDLQRDLEAARSVYANFLLRAQETREQATLDTTNARIISRALPPRQASWPPLLALVAGAAFVGLGCGAGFALVSEYARPHILSVSQAENILDAPVVAIFGRSPTAKKGARPPESAEIEAAGLALVNLLGRSGRRRQPDSIVLVSAERDAGARVRAAQLLAGAASERGDHVLFIDAARPAPSDEQPGLLNVLAGDYTISEAVDFDPRSNIAYMELGFRSGHSRGLPRGSALRFLDDVGRRFDLVVVDAGDITRNASIGSLMGAADHVVFLAKLTETLQSEATRCAEAAAVMGSGVTAAILFEPGGKAAS
jgi:uncharacterized protein involved in exopolysaccharide biosynthesis